ncbi:MAG: hypothetical protein KME04_07010 [Pleurocapsa minor GSE-CHR-MK-17-07R]|jgi:hypothetical protein|nr:hypothetical protein [Pleurocapsa minor GSE-CHR-MK 17-07R]
MPNITVSGSRGLQEDPTGFAPDDQRVVLHMGNGAIIVRVNVSETFGVFVLGLICMGLLILLARKNRGKKD